MNCGENPLPILDFTIDEKLRSDYGVGDACLTLETNMDKSLSALLGKTHSWRV
jgi:hypothetical protein